MKRRAGQAILEYILLVVMLAVTVAVVIRGTNRTLYRFWTGLAGEIAAPCPNCVTGKAPPEPPGPN